MNPTKKMWHVSLDAVLQNDSPLEALLWHTRCLWLCSKELQEFHGFAYVYLVHTRIYTHDRPFPLEHLAIVQNYKQELVFMTSCVPLPSFKPHAVLMAPAQVIYKCVPLCSVCHPLEGLVFTICTWIQMY